MPTEHFISHHRAVTLSARIHYRGNQLDIVSTQRKEAPALWMLGTCLHDGAPDGGVLPGPEQRANDQPG